MSDIKQIKPIEVKPTELPSRTEIRHIKKTGQTLDGHKVHPLDIQRLRTAKLVDLHKFAEEVNFANRELKEYVDEVQMQRDFTFMNLIGFLIEKKIISEAEFKEYAEKANAEIKRVREEIIKAKESKEAKKTEEIVQP